MEPGSHSTSVSGLCDATADGERLSPPHPQVVLIVVGLIGSGKSTFSEALQQFYPDFHRCNQDELGNRRQVEEVARRHLQRGGSVCIDRTNINASQRAVWINIAREYPGTVAWVLHFDTPLHVCEDRLRTRVGHPTIMSPEHGISVLRRFSSEYQPPSAHEGYDRILRLEVADQRPEYSQDDITSILDRLRDSPPVVSDGGWRQQGYRSRGTDVRGRGSSYGGYRGRYPTFGTGYNYRGRGADRGHLGLWNRGQSGSARSYSSRGQTNEDQPYERW